MIDYEAQRRAYIAANPGMTLAQLEWEVRVRQAKPGMIYQLNAQSAVMPDPLGMMQYQPPWKVAEERQAYRERADAAGGDAAYAQSLDARIAKAKARATPEP